MKISLLSTSGWYKCIRVSKEHKQTCLKQENTQHISGREKTSMQLPGGKQGRGDRRYAGKAAELNLMKDRKAMLGRGKREI